MLEKKFLGPYQLQQMIGQGGMGTVYEALDARLNRRVAIKTVRPDLFTDTDMGFYYRFVREARAAAALSHSNIVSIYDVGEEDGNIYIVMELVDGLNLKQRLEKEPPPTLRTILDALIGVCEGLHHAHERDLVHRDMKPANVLLGTDHAKITDFGLALRRNLDQSHSGALAGTPHYMSPEQYDSPYVDRRSDIFSTGVILYESLTGRLPFDGDTPGTVMKKILMAKPDPPSLHRTFVPATLNEVAMRALDKDPGGRFQTAQEFAEALRRVTKDLVTRPLDGPGERTPRMRTTKRMVNLPASKPSLPRTTPHELHSPVAASTEPSQPEELGLTVPVVFVVLALSVISLLFAFLMVFPSG